MRFQHTAVGLVVLAALAVAPAGLARSSVTIDKRIVAALRTGPVANPLVENAIARKDTRRSCQAGKSGSHARASATGTVGETERRSSAVACEQPPRSAPNLAGALQQAQAAAVAATG